MGRSSDRQHSMEPLLASSAQSYPDHEIAAEAGGTASLINLEQYSQPEYAIGRPKWVVLLWWLVQATLFPLTLHAHHAPRRLLLRWFGAQVGRNTVIRPSARFYYPWKIEIGDHSWIGSDVELYSLDRISIGSHCVVSQKSYLCTGSHDPSDPTFGLITAPIVLGNGVWVAADCFIGPGVTVGANTVVGARSSVFGDLPEQCLCWGTPCRPNKPRHLQQKLVEG